MKGYGWLFLITGVLLLLLPLPALAHSDATDTPPASSGLPTESVTDTSSENKEPTDEPTDKEATFRILCGEQVVTLTEREFLIRTLAMEMSPTYHSEALKAQAVAAYTYYGRRRQQQKGNADPALRGADFVTPHTNFPDAYTTEALQQRWGSQYDMHCKKLTEAVEAVLGQTVTYEGALIDACYHSLSNGSTEDAQTVWGAKIPYLQAVASPGDRLAPDYEATVTLSVEEMKKALSACETPLSLGDDPAGWFGAPTLSAAGYVATQTVGGTALAGTGLRQLLGLRSASFSVAYAEGTFTVTTHGYGHGVGMSQYGADYLARQGYSYKEILTYYYTGTTVE